MIRKSRIDDKDAIAKIWRKNTSMLGGVQMAALKRSIENGCCHVAEIENKVVGFVEFYTRKDGGNTIYHIATDEQFQKRGIGAALLFSVPCPIRLRVTSDNEKAIRFYEHYNMIRTGEETSRTGRRLFVYELRTLFIQVAGNNVKFPEICRQAGIGYGSRHDDQIRSFPTMIDINWKKYDWSQYLEILKTHKPIMAMVADYESPTQKEIMLEQVQDLRELGILRIMVCPKFDGAIADIPDGCIIAVSVPSKYAGFIPNFKELKGKKIHLLGGSPVKQRDYFLKLNAIASVISVDGNSHTSGDGRLWLNGRWQFLKNKTPYYDLVSTSAKNIAKMFSSIENTQPPLF